MSKKKKDKLLLNLLEGERYKHRVAMVTDEGAFNQHEPNSNMARMFVVMLLIHVVVIGGIIIYDFMNGEEAPVTTLSENYLEQPVSVLPASAVNMDLDKNEPQEEYATYDWKSGDSIRSVAQKLKVSEEVLIKLNKVDQGRQLNTNDIILYPKQPVLKAVGISVAGTNGELAKPVQPEASIQAAEVPINLALPGETGFSFSATIEDELTPAPAVTASKVQHSPPPAVSKEASGMPVRVELPVSRAKVEEAPPVPAPAPVAKKEVEKPVIKAIPYIPPAAKPPVVEKPAVKKVVDAPPPAKKEPVKASAATHVVQSGDTLYRIATRHGISVAALQAANKNAKAESLKIGMKLNIPRK
ncbi:LysM domain-containing protein [Prosthecobacter fusiformis]|uniref:LysM domain-containing protein n=1 Tax=Prosthecobacter fusiformis TaxID=48464 RepID=A0A4R7RKS7_9BACT|nr:LysM domain-containing protein [Prosthecobacter fusiformis]TDU64245.1 LysM domain-containing protein [Prosthecobacter fusiformis]